MDDKDLVNGIILPSSSGDKKRLDGEHADDLIAKGTPKIHCTTQTISTSTATRDSAVANNGNTTLSPLALSKSPSSAERQSSTESASSNSARISNGGSLSDSAQSSSTNLRTLKRLYGRSKEAEKIKDVFQNHIGCTESNTLVLITGPLGCGKTSLGRKSLDESILASGGYVMTWRFQHTSDIDFGSELMGSIHDLCLRIRDQGDAQIVKSKIFENIGVDGYRVLMDMFQFLRDVFGSDMLEAKDSRSVDVSGQHLELVKGLFRALCEPDRPLIVFLDDLHHADEELCSLLLLEHLLCDVSNAGIFFVATAVGDFDETDDTAGNLAKMLEKMCQNDDVRVETIKLSNLSQDETNHMVADLLHVSKETCSELSNMLYHGTEGNGAFVLESVHMLHDVGVLEYDSERREWNCRDGGLEVLSNCRSCEDVVTERVCALDEEMQFALKSCACLGRSVSADVLEVLFGSKGNCDAHELLNLAAIKGFMEPIGMGCGVAVEDNVMRFDFCHDAIRKTSYRLIAKDERSEFHLRLGRRLWRDYNQRVTQTQPKCCDNANLPFSGYSKDEHTTPSEVSMILEQFCLGAAAMSNQRERYGVAMLCLELVKDAVAWSMFPIAVATLDLGLAMLGENCWREEYDLSLSLYNAAAEANYATGEFDKVNAAVHVILQRARIFEDKIQAHCTRLYVLNSTEKADVIIGAAVDVLEKLGVSPLGKPNARSVRREYYRTQLLLRGRSIESMRRLPMMSDAKQTAALRILNIVFLVAFLGDPYLAPLIAIRMIRITVKHGLCAISAYSFASWGMLITSYGRDVMEGSRYAYLALEMLERFDAREWQSRVHAAVYGCVLPWNEPLTKCVNELERGSNIGMDTGDLEFGSFCAHIKIQTLFDLGRPLRELEAALVKCTNEMKSSKQITMLSITSPFLCLVKAMQKENGVEVYESNICDYLVEDLTLDGDFKETWKSYHCMYIYYFMGLYNEASREAKIAIKYDTFPFRSFDVTCFPLLVGLSHIAHMREVGSRRKLIRSVRSALKMLSNYSQTTPSFCLGKKLLLRAEMRAFSSRHRHLAFQDYVGAMSVYYKEGITHEGAIANELCARYLVNTGRHVESQQYFEDSIQLYIKWGCQDKVSKLRREVLAVCQQASVKEQSKEEMLLGWKNNSL